MPNALIIVESPAKARTLKRYLGKGYEVKASVGHIRDLPVNTLGVDVEHGFEPQYVTIKGKAKVIADLKKAAQKVDEIFLAPDPDREGEAIAWHIAQSLKSLKKPMHRALFHELTKKAILNALQNATQIDQHRFEAQQTRRILDRLVGYQISPLLWDKVRRGLSAGRVQSVAVRMVCEREQAIEAFQSEEYWTVAVDLLGKLPPPFTATLDRKGKDKVKITDAARAEAIVADLRNADHLVLAVDKKERKRRASPPFITSTMQQDANRKLRFSAKKTMTLAQRLYEGIELGQEGPTGLITYMRTDSPRVNDEALEAVRGYIGQAFGADYLPAKPILYKTSSSSQDAHEAIRPTDVSLTPEKVASSLDKDLLGLYTLIWKRFVASQMNPAVYDQTTVHTGAGDYRLKAVGSIMRFLGFMTLYVEGRDEDEEGAGAAEGDRQGDVTLPDLAPGDTLRLRKIEPKQHFTQPPPRYTEATLVKALEENGVGRPSTYAAIISTIVDKEYVLLERRQFHPTDLGRLVNELLVAHFPSILDVDFTASMEARLDKVEEGQADWRDLLGTFYESFRQTLDKARQEMQSVKMQAIPTGIKCPQCGGILQIKWGRMGEFLACENYPQCTFTQNFKRGPNGEVIPIERDEPEVSNVTCDKCGRPMVYKTGRFGKFLACSGYPECKNIAAETTGVPCAEKGCGGELVRKVSKRGKVFYGCNRYPECRFAVWDKPVNKPCPLCHSPLLVEKESKKRGKFLKCPEKSCRYFETIPDQASK